MRPLLKKEYLFVLTFSFLILLINFAPYIYGYLISTPQDQFSGSFHFINDYFTYLAKMKAGQISGWLYENRYSVEKDKGVFIYTFYLALGKAARLFHLSLPSMFHLARVILGFSLLLSSYYFISQFTENKMVRKISFIFICFASGLGWSVFIFFPSLIFKSSVYWPIDLWLPEAIPFMRFSHMPHFLFAHLLFLFSLIWFLKAQKTGKFIFSLLSGFLGLILGFVLPFEAVVLYFTLFIFLVFLFFRSKQKRDILYSLKHFLAFVFISCPALLYMIWLAKFHPLWKKIFAQNTISSPHPLMYILGLGLLFVFAVMGSQVILKEGKDQSLILIAWPISIFLLVYAPIVVQRRFIEAALYIPLSFLASLGVFEVLRNVFARRLTQRKIIFFSLILLFFMIPSNFLRFSFTFATLNERTPWIFISQEEKEAFSWLDQNVPLNSPILSLEVSGNMIPAMSRARSFIGHGIETIDFEAKEAKAISFYRMEISRNESKEFLDKNSIDYIYLGQREKALGFEADKFDFLELVYENEGVKIYKIK